MAGKVTAKGQITIPLEIREQLGILPGSRVEFELVDGGVLVRKSAEGGGRGAELVARLRGRATTRMTTDEIMQLTRGE
jgi:AbrB family looped-hinge helix DNA binding protein